PQSGAFSTISSLCSHTASTVIYTLSLHDALPIWEDGLEVVRQRADGRRHRQRDEQLGRPPHVAKPGPDLALGPRRDRPGPQLLGPPEQQAAEHGDVAQGVAEERPAVTRRGDHAAARRRPAPRGAAAAAPSRRW